MQPYGLVIPASYTAGGKNVRLDIWCHGRGETLSEVNFLDQRQKQVGQLRCAIRSSSSVRPLLQRLQVRRRNRRAGSHPTRSAAATQLTTTGPACAASRWAEPPAGNSPSTMPIVGSRPIRAGFAETAEFLKVFQKETVQPAWYEQKLWHLVRLHRLLALNLLQCPTVAYSGEIDSQKQAADIMEQARQSSAFNLTHIIGPQTKHAYHKDAAVTVERLMASIAERGRARVPREIHFVTYTLRYHKMGWVSVEGLGEHWQRARSTRGWVDEHRVHLKTDNVTDLTLSMPAGWSPLGLTQQPAISIDGQELTGPKPGTDRSWSCSLYRDGSQWQIGLCLTDELRKRPLVQGPIDDAFMDSFIFVRPTGKSELPAVDRWARSELERAVEHWRRQFRGQDASKTIRPSAKPTSPRPTLSCGVIRTATPCWQRLPIGCRSNGRASKIKVGDRTFSAADTRRCWSIRTRSTRRNTWFSTAVLRIESMTI